MKPTATIKINVTRILKDHLYQGKNGKYLDLALWPNKDGADQYGNTHFVTQSVSKAARESGVKGPIIGNATINIHSQGPTQPAPQPKQSPPPDANNYGGGDDVPF
jgi:hypothetical protein